MEIRDVKTKMADERCPVCKIGFLRPTGVVFPTNPPQFPHKCTHCEYGATFPVRYPYIIHE